MRPFLSLKRAMFSMVHGNALIYNQCWEDPRLDRAAMRLGSNDSVLVITSAGCNALDYLLEGPRRVYAVDLNPRQNALLELKVAGIRYLDYRTFFRIFGGGQFGEFAEVYHDCLRWHLSEGARRFWDDHSRIFAGRDRRGSFYFHGTTGWVAWIMNQYIDRIAKVRTAVDAAFLASSVDEQREIYDDAVRPALWGKSLRWFVRRDTTMAMLGVPRPQREQIERDYAGGVAQFIEDCIDAVFRVLPLRDNYFWRVYLTGQYTPKCCPEYLREENFEKLRGLVDRLSIHTDSVAGFLEKTEARISRFVLLDHQDWLSSHAAGELEREWNAIFRRASEGARVLWRSAGMTSDFVDRVEVKSGRGTRRVGQMLTYRRCLSQELHEQDRVHTYGSFHVADLMPA